MLDQAASTEHGDHSCFAYGSADARRRMVTDYLREGLRRNEKLYFVAPDPEKRLRKDLALPDPEVRTLLQSGRLSLLPVEVAYLPNGEFDADTRLSTYVDLTRAAVREGFAGLRVAADATSVAVDPRAMERFASYELRAGVLAAQMPFAALCLYDRRECGHEAIEMLHTVHTRNLDVDRPARPRYRLYPVRNRFVLAGEIDLTTAASLSHLLATAARERGSLTLDVSEVSFIDVAGMRALERAANAVEDAVVVSTSVAFRRVWDVVRWSEQGSALRLVERGQSR